MSTGCSVEVEGKVVASPSGEQKVELVASRVSIIGSCDPEVPHLHFLLSRSGKGNLYLLRSPLLLLFSPCIVFLWTTKKYPLAKKRHSLEFLREIPHLRVRSNTIGGRNERAVFPE